MPKGVIQNGSEFVTFIHKKSFTINARQDSYLIIYQMVMFKIFQRKRLHFLYQLLILEIISNKQKVRNTKLLARSRFVWYIVSPMK